MIRIKYHVPGTPPATLFSHAEGDVSPSVITLIQYDSETFFEGQFETFEDLMQRFDASMVNWINVDGLYDVELLRKLGQKFSIHPLALEDMLNTTQRPKVEHYTNHYFIISEMIYKEENRRIALEQLSIVLGKSYVLRNSGGERTRCLRTGPLTPARWPRLRAQNEVRLSRLCAARRHGGPILSDP
jgi:magnesium transporter